MRREGVEAAVDLSVPEVMTLRAPSGRSSSNPERMYQQNHVGMHRSDDAGKCACPANHFDAANTLLAAAPDQACLEDALRGFIQQVPLNAGSMLRGSCPASALSSWGQGISV